MEAQSFQRKNEKKYLTFQQIISQVENQRPYLIGICGMPGAGKSTISQKLNAAIPNSIIVPMDGFHLYIKDLDEQGKKRRGAPFTFDLQRFKQKLLQLKKNKNFPVKFPSFDHALKDPIQNDIQITQDIKCVIIEGLYIFDKTLQLDEINFWDLKIFIDELEDICLERVIKRCIEKGIEDSLQKAIQRGTKSDMVNGKYVMENTSWKNMYFLTNPNSF